MESRTTRRSRTWRQPDGSLRSQIYTVPVNYRDERGRWQEIDSSLVDSVRSGVAVESAANDFEVRLPQDAATDAVRYTGRDGDWVSFRMEGLRGKPAVAGSEATYRDADGADRVVYEVTATGLKESVVLAAAPAGPVAYRYALEMSAGLRPVLRGSGEIEVLDADDAVVFTMPAPFVVDSADPEPVVSTDVRYRLEEAGGEWALVVEPSTAWLSDPARVYPVVVDPSVHQGDTVKDCWINEASPTASYCGGENVNMQVGTSNGKRRRSLVKFAIGAIPTAAVVNEADALLFLRWGQATSSLTADYKLRQFKPYSGINWSWGNAATWDNRTVGDTWTDPGAMSDTLNSNVASRSMDGSEGGYKQLDATRIVQNWVGGDDNRGLLLHQVGHDTENVLNFASSEGGESNKWPYLEVTYNLPPSEPTISLDPCLDPCDETSRVTDTTQPTLRATATDTDDTDLTYAFTVRDPATGAVVVTSPDVTAAEGQQAEWTVPSGMLSDGGSYEFSAEVDDGDTQLISEVVAFDVDVDQPPAEPAAVTLAPCVPTDCSGPLTTDSLTPDLSATATDPDTAQLDLDFEVREAGASTVIATGSDGPLASGGSGTWTVPTGTLADQGSYEFRIGSRDATNTTWAGWKQFDVDLDEAPSTPAGLALTPCETGCASWVADTATPTFHASASDADSDTLDYSYQIREAATGEPVTSGTVDHVDQGTTASWLVPVGAIPNEGSYQLRVGVYDGTTTTWSTWSDFDVDLPANTPTAGGERTLANSETWTAANSPYILSGRVTVPPGTTLTMQPGTVVKIDSGGIDVSGGRLDVRGAANRPVVITSQEDDSVLGDVDPTDGPPAPGNYDIGLVFGGTGPGIPVSTVSNLSMRYGGRPNVSCQVTSEALLVNGGRVDILNSEFLHSQDAAAIRAKSGQVTVRNSRFAHNTCGAVSHFNAARFFNNVFEATNGYSLVANHGGVTAEGNWFLSRVMFYGNEQWSRDRADLFHNAILDSSSSNHEDLKHNWWGLPLGVPTAGCLSEEEEAGRYPPVNSRLSLGCYELGLKYYFDDYYLSLLPAMDSPPAWPDAGLQGSRALPEGTDAGQQLGAGGAGGSAYAYRASGQQSDPVNSATGSYVDQVADAAVPGVGVPLVAHRTYNSADTASGVLGQGWSFGYDHRLDFPASDKALFTAGDGQRVQFAKADGAWRGGTGATAELIEDGNQYVLTTRAGVEYRFTAAGHPVSVLDRNGEGLTFARDDAGRVTEATNGSRSLVFSHVNGLLDRVTLDDGRYVAYGYTGGLLTSVRDLAGETNTYAYDALGRLASETDPLDHEVMRIAYDAATGRVGDQWDALGGHTTFAWDPVAEVSTMTDPEGGEWVDDYDDGIIARRTDPLGRTTRYAYDTDLQLVLSSDANGVATRLQYNGRGDLTSSTTSLGRTTTTYNNRHDPVQAVNAKGVITDFGYDGAGNLTSLTRTTPGGEVLTETYTVNGRGLVTASTNAAGKTTNYDYNTAGDQTSVTTPEGHQTRFTFDATGRQTAVIDPRGQTSGGTPADYTTTYTHTDRDQLDTVVDPLGGTVDYDYDAAGQLEAVTDPKGRSTDYTFDAAGHVLSVQGPDPQNPGGRHTYASSTYDVNGNPLTETDESGRVTGYTYDAANQVQTMAKPGIDGLFTFGYDNLGNLASMTDPAGQVTRFSYNDQNRPTRIDYPTTTPATPDVTFGYDGHGNRTSMVDGHGTSTYTYDALDRMVEVERGETFTYSHDKLGLLTRVEGPGGIHTYTYTDDGRMATVKHRTGVDLETFDLLATYDYNALGAPASAQLGDGSSWTRGYDRLGRVSRLTNTAADGSTLLDDSIAMDAIGNPTAITRDDGSVDTYRYDALDRLTDVCYDTADCDTATDYVRWAYDLSGNRTQEVRPGGTTSYSYDPDGGWLDSTTGPTGTTTYTHDAYGRLVSDGTTSYEYNHANQLTSQTTGGATTTFTYDGDSRRLTQTAGNQTTNYWWDPRSYQLAAETLTDTSSGTTTQLRSYHHGLGTIGISTPGTGDSYYHADIQGSVRAHTSADGSVQATSDYEPYGRVRDQTQPDPDAPDNPIGWAGQYTDTSGETHLRARQYHSEIGAFVTPDPAQATSSSATYTYADSNPMVAGDPYGLFPWSGDDDVNSDAPTIGGVLGQFVNVAASPFRRIRDACGEAQKGSCASEVTRAALIGAGGAGAAAGITRQVIKARRAVAKGADEGIDLYRHVSPGELADIGKNGFRPGAGSLDGKWFAESGEHASEWGRVLNGGNGSVVKVRVPTSLGNQLMRLEKLDGIGPARYVEPHQLAELNRHGRGVW